MSLLSGILCLFWLIFFTIPVECTQARRYSLYILVNLQTAYLVHLTYSDQRLCWNLGQNLIPVLICSSIHVYHYESWVLFCYNIIWKVFPYLCCCKLCPHQAFACMFPVASCSVPSRNFKLSIKEKDRSWETRTCYRNRKTLFKWKLLNVCLSLVWVYCIAFNYAHIRS